MVKELHTSRFTFALGASFHMFGLGIVLSKWSFDITLGFLWLSIEW
jgi:hypothetical protein